MAALVVDCRRFPPEFIVNEVVGIIVDLVLVGSFVRMSHPLSHRLRFPFPFAFPFL